MESKELLSRFDRERRQDPPTFGTYAVEKAENLTRLVVASKSFILWSRLDPAEHHRAVAYEKEWARARDRLLVWKLYSHDPSPGLSAALEDAGFRPRPRETLMVFDLATATPVGPTSSELRIERVRDEGRYRDFVSVDRGAFGAGPLGPPAQRRPVDPGIGLFVAYWHGTPASIGRAEYEPGHVLAGLFGGGTAPEFRGRGIYRELVRTRLEWARERGARGVFTEAVDTTSRPILERIGFAPVAGIESWIWGAAGPAT